MSLDYENYQISLAKNAIVPVSLELSGWPFFLFILACGVVSVGLGFPIVFSLVKNCKRGRTIKMKGDVSTYMDVSMMDETMRASMMQSRESVRQTQLSKFLGGGHDSGAINESDGSG